MKDGSDHSVGAGDKSIHRYNNKELQLACSSSGKTILYTSDMQIPPHVS